MSVENKPEIQENITRKSTTAETSPSKEQDFFNAMQALELQHVQLMKSSQSAVTREYSPTGFQDTITDPEAYKIAQSEIANIVKLKESTRYAHWRYQLERATNNMQESPQESGQLLLEAYQGTLLFMQNSKGRKEQHVEGVRELSERINEQLDIFTSSHPDIWREIVDKAQTNGQIVFNKAA